MVIRKKAVCFKEGKQFFGDNGLRSLSIERNDCNRAINKRSDLSPFWGIWKTCSSFQEEGNIPRL